MWPAIAVLFALTALTWGGKREPTTPAERELNAAGIPLDHPLAVELLSAEGRLRDTAGAAGDQLAAQVESLRAALGLPPSSIARPS